MIMVLFTSSLQQSWSFSTQHPQYAKYFLHFSTFTKNLFTTSFFYLFYMYGSIFYKYIVCIKIFLYFFNHLRSKDLEES